MAPPDRRSMREKFRIQRAAAQFEQQVGSATQVKAEEPSTSPAPAQVAKPGTKSRLKHQQPLGKLSAVPSSGLLDLDTLIHEELRSGPNGPTPCGFIGDVLFEVLKERLSKEHRPSSKPSPTPVPLTALLGDNRHEATMKHGSLQNQFHVAQMNLQYDAFSGKQLQQRKSDFSAAGSPSCYSPSAAAASAKYSVVMLNMDASGKVLPWTQSDVEVLLQMRGICIHSDVGAVQMLPDGRAVLTSLLPEVKDRCMSFDGTQLHPSAQIWLCVTSLGGGAPTHVSPTRSPQNVSNGDSQEAARVFNTLQERTALDHAAADLQRVLSEQAITQGQGHASPPGQTEQESARIGGVCERDLLEKLLFR